MLLFGWAGSSVVTALATEAAGATTLVLISLRDFAIGNLFPKPTVPPGDFILGFASGTGSLVDSANPLSGSVSTLLFRLLDAVLLGKVLDSGVGFFDFWAATTVVSVLTTVLTLIGTTHNYLSLSPSISWHGYSGCQAFYYCIFSILQT
jgi:hypothetical protein